MTHRNRSQGGDEIIELEDDDLTTILVRVDLDIPDSLHPVALPVVPPAMLPTAPSFRALEAAVPPRRGVVRSLAVSVVLALVAAIGGVFGAHGTGVVHVDGVAASGIASTVLTRAPEPLAPPTPDPVALLDAAPPRRDPLPSAPALKAPVAATWKPEARKAAIPSAPPPPRVVLAAAPPPPRVVTKTPPARDDERKQALDAAALARAQLDATF